MPAIGVGRKAWYADRSGNNGLSSYLTEKRAYITNTKLMLYGEINAVCCEFHTNTHIDSVRGNAKLWYV
jgi:hypothetical protein